tara:strand:- start:171 stop:872 length:702 start_codon:yes stop_codon:yes gene_type:complete
MALPKIETPVHNLILPSSGEQIKFRPFLMKEQKLLMLSQEGENKSELFDTLSTVIDECTFKKLNVKNLPMFDIEYLFLKIRAKSVGSKLTVSLICPDDKETRSDVDLDLDDIEVQIDEQHTNMIQINDDIELVMQYPILEDMKSLQNSSTLELFKIINKCVKEVRHGENIYSGPDMTEKDLNDFFESMNAEQFDKVNQFFDTMPRLRHIVKIVNPKTKVESEVLLEGLESFLE